MSAVFIVEPEPRRAPPAENFADFLRRHKLNVTVRVTQPRLGVFDYTASLPQGYFVADYPHSSPVAASQTSRISALDSVQKLASALAGRRVVRPGWKSTSIAVPPLIVPSDMAPGDWMTRDASV